MGSMHPITAVVLAGGASRRMGRDKRLELVEGSPLIRRVIVALSYAAETLVVVDPSRPLPHMILDGTSVRLVADIRRGQGPLAGLEAGLAATRDDLVIVVAADMPWLEPAVTELQLERLASEPGADLACLLLDGRRQPFPIACRRVPVLTRVTALLDAGEQRLRSILEGPRVEAIGEPEWRTADPSGRTVLDVDTPSDLLVIG